MSQSSRLIMGTALGLAALAIAIDHSKHRLPEPVAVSDTTNEDNATRRNPCSLGNGSPCSLGKENPCDLKPKSPCSL